MRSQDMRRGEGGCGSSEKITRIRNTSVLPPKRGELIPLPSRAAYWFPFVSPGLGHATNRRDPEIH